MLAYRDSMSIVTLGKR